MPESKAADTVAAATTAAAASAANGAAGRPAWLPEGYDAPEKFAEDSTRWRSRAEAAETFEKRFGSFDTFPDRLKAAEASVKAAAIAEYQAAHPVATTQAKETVADAGVEWETLTPTQQRKAITDELRSEQQSFLQGEVTKYWNMAQQELAKGLSSQQQQMNLLIKGFEISRKTGIPLEQVWPEVEKLATAPADQLMSMAVERLGSAANLKKQVDEAVAAAHVKWEEEAKNKVRANLAATGPSSMRELQGIRRGPDGKVTKQSIRDAVMQKFANGELSS